VAVVTFSRKLAEWIVEPSGIWLGPFPNRLSKRIKPVRSVGPPTITVVEVP
jgi:hypothetical protein